MKVSHREPGRANAEYVRVRIDSDAYRQKHAIALSRRKPQEAQGQRKPRDNP